MNLQDLKKVIPHKWRVQSTNKYGSQCVAYIDARDVQDILDEVCSPENWQVTYAEHKGNLFASIAIKCQYNDENGVWVWKSDCGTESNIEKQKGESSDAFKRAAVMWGVGRFLYSKKIIKIKEVIEANGKYHPAQNGKRIYDVNQYCNNLTNGVNNNIPTPKRLTPAQVKVIPQAEDVNKLRTVLKLYTLQPNEKVMIDKRIAELTK